MTYETRVFLWVCLLRGLSVEMGNECTQTLKDLGIGIELLHAVSSNGRGQVSYVLDIVDTAGRGQDLLRSHVARAGDEYVAAFDHACGLFMLERRQ